MTTTLSKEFPTDPRGQCKFANWFRETFPHVKFALYDGAVEQYEPDKWRWKYAIVGTWNTRDGVKTFPLNAGDTLTWDEGKPETMRPRRPAPSPPPLPENVLEAGELKKVEITRAELNIKEGAILAGKLESQHVKDWN